jgi:dienelactone hydrolase
MEDNGFDDAAEARLRTALDEAGVAFTLEQYHARHGWVPTDMPSYDRGESERHYRTLRGLLEATMS